MEKELSHSALQLAEQILSDCGHSTNNQSLLERVAKRITEYGDSILSTPVSSSTADLKFIRPKCQYQNTGDIKKFGIYLESELSSNFAKNLEILASWIETQRNDVPATGTEVASTIREAARSYK